MREFRFGVVCIAILMPLLFAGVYLGAASMRCAFVCREPKIGMDMNTQLLGNGGDAYMFLGFQNIAHDNLSKLTHPFADTTLLRYPNGFHFSYGFDGAYSAFVGGVLGFVFSPIMSYNLTVVSIMLFNVFISAFCFYKIAVAFSPSEEKNFLLLKSVLGGLYFGFSTTVLVRMNGHLNLAVMAGFPILAMALLRMYKSISSEEKVSVADVIGIPFSFYVLSLGSLEYLFFTFVLLVPFFFYLCFNFKKSVASFRPLLSHPGSAIVIFASALLFLALFVITFYGYVHAILTHTIFIAKKSGKPASLMEVIVPILLPTNTMGPVWLKLGFPAGGIDKSIFLGLSGFYILLLFFIKSANQHRKKWTFAFVAYISVFLSGILHLPVIVSSHRFALFICLILGILFAVDNVFKRWSAWILLAFMLVERMLVVAYVGPVINVQSLEAMRDIPGKAVMTMPFAPGLLEHSIYPAYFKKGVFDGAYHWTATDDPSREFIKNDTFEVFKCTRVPTRSDTEVFSTLRSMDVHGIYVDLPGINNFKLADLKDNCLEIVDWLESMEKQGYITSVYRDKTAVAYAIADQ